MLFFALICCIAVLTAFLPILAPRIARHYDLQTFPAPAWLPVAAAIFYIGSLYLPDILISGETDTFQQHFVGGVYTAMLYVYFARLFQWRRHWLVMLVGLYVWTSALGVTNELVEFAFNQLHISRINIRDTSWDLAANTAGSFAGYAVLQLLARLRLLR
jgi:hypothetical protein